jgi:hypothetical protein
VKISGGSFKNNRRFVVAKNSHIEVDGANIE